MDFLNYLAEEAMIMVPVLYIIGSVIKPILAIPDKYIPLILLIISIIGTCVLLPGGFSPQNVVQGIFVTGVSVLCNQVVVQSKKEY